MFVHYRAKEVLRLLDKVGKLAAFDYYFSLKVLDHMELTPELKGILGDFRFSAQSPAVLRFLADQQVPRPDEGFLQGIQQDFIWAQRNRTSPLVFPLRQLPQRHMVSRVPPLRLA